MNNYKPLLALPFVYLIIMFTEVGAATQQAEIDLSVTHTPYVSFIGTAPGSNRMYDNNYIANWIFPINVDLGTLGLESNIAGDCDINFSSLNSFDLLHIVSNASLTQYKVLYESQEFGINANPTLHCLVIV